MEGGNMLSTLMFGTLIVVAVIIAVMLVRFLSHRRNRHPMANERERNIDEIRRDGPSS